MSHPVENIMKSTMEQLRQMVDVNTIVGDPILTAGETMILPVSKVSLGFVSGGGEYSAANCGAPVKKAGEALDAGDGRYPFAGMAVAGLSLTPMAFVAVNQGQVRVMPAQYKDGIDRLADMAPEVVSTVERLISGEKKGSGSCCTAND